VNEKGDESDDNADEQDLPDEATNPGIIPRRGGARP
jgi:hypothetical protein